MSALIINIETSGPICSVGLADKGNIFAYRESSPSNSHAEYVSIFINEVLEEAAVRHEQVDAVAISAGPGSYTGLRIGTSVAKGLCFGLNIPLIAISSLQIMASKIKAAVQTKDGFFCSSIDARRDDIYFGVYDIDLNILQNPMAATIDEKTCSLLSSFNPLYIGGSGGMKLFSFKKCNFINTHLIEIDHNCATDMSSLSFHKFVNQNFENLISFEPFYLKGVYISNQSNG